jgi:hypothetical protein
MADTKVVKRGFLEAAAFLEIEEFPQLPALQKRNSVPTKRKHAMRHAGGEVRGSWRSGIERIRAWIAATPTSGSSKQITLSGRGILIADSLWKPVKQIEAELELCESRCSNCHKIRHWEERQQSREFFNEELW